MSPEVPASKKRSVDLAGAVAVVTGGAAGIGKALAIEAALRGASVVIGDIDDASMTVEAVVAIGGQARWQHCDVGVKGDVVALRDAAISHFGAVNVVCSNVGVGAAGALHALADDEFERTMRVNVTGSYWNAEDLRPWSHHVRRSGRAVILFTGSEHSLGVPPSDEPPYVPVASVYTMAKYALLGMAAVARRDLSETRVHVAILCPGWTATESLVAYGKADEHIGMVLDSFGQEPSDVAKRAFDGLTIGQHIIPTSPISRDFVVATHQEIIEAMESIV